ncbi:unnamed protein product [Linum trigynum]|uniref:Uncharacterized protein n=1 Tax=Linum trigynum TaxID=586398 RepID=A0AAV2GCA8_9ROSI
MTNPTTAAPGVLISEVSEDIGERGRSSSAAIVTSSKVGQENPLPESRITSPTERTKEGRLQVALAVALTDMEAKRRVAAASRIAEGASEVTELVLPAWRTMKKKLPIDEDKEEGGNVPFLCERRRKYPSPETSPGHFQESKPGSGRVSQWLMLGQPKQWRGTGLDAVGSDGAEGLVGPRRVDCLLKKVNHIFGHGLGRKGEIVGLSMTRKEQPRGLKVEAK